MTNELKSFIEKNVKLIDDNNWRQLFINAYEDALMTSEVLELHNILLEANITDSTSLRNDLLYEYIADNINFVRDKYLKNAADPNDMRVVDSYVVQFLRRYLNNTFGVPEQEAVQFIWYNQTPLGIRLEPTEKTNGQYGIKNYIIHYDGLS